MVVLLGVFGGILAFGFMGLFLGPTLLAVAYSLLGDWINSVPTAPVAVASEPVEEDHD
ncbi:putative inner membrane protein [compost metagenome]